MKILLPPSGTGRKMAAGAGMPFAIAGGMVARTIGELIAWQLADEFKTEVYGLLKRHPAASKDYRFRDQLRKAAASVGVNVAEGFHRFRHGEFRHFLSIAVASLGEAVQWLHDGIKREYFPASECANAFQLARRCRAATLRLHESLRTASPEQSA